MKKAVMVAGGRIWTMTLTTNPDGSLTIQNFDPEDGEGEMFFEQLDKIDVIHETEGRVVEAVTINGVRFDVQNKQNVFTYRQPL